MKKTIFTGAGVAIITPMNEDFSVNYPALGTMIDSQIAHQTDCIVITGTTGEASTLTDEEQIETIRYTVERTAGRIPVIAGTGSNDTRHAIKLSCAAKDCGADALLLVTPYYNKTSQDGLIRHFTAIADAAKLPVVLYNVPSRTGMSIQPKTFQTLSQHEYISAVKEASGNMTAILETRYLCGDNLDLYSGNDDQILPLLSLGGKGVISVLSNVCPKETHDICALYFAGKTQESAQLQIRLTGLISALFCDVNPIPVKEACELLGMHAGPCRMPLAPLSAENRQRLVREMKATGLL